MNNNDETKELVHAIVRALQPETMTLKLALALLERAEFMASTIQIPMSITVVDNGGNLVAQHRMDDAILGSISISRSKAYTAIALRSPTDELAKSAQPGQPLYGLSEVGQQGFCIFGGGIPIIRLGLCIGGIGVSGGSVEQDISVAKYAVQED